MRRQPHLPAMTVAVAVPMAVAARLPTASLSETEVRIMDEGQGHQDLGHHGVRDEVQEGVTQQSSAGEGQEDLQEPLLLRAVVEGDEEEDEEWRGRDEESGHDGVEPDGAVDMFLLLVIIPALVKLLTVLLPG